MTRVSSPVLIGRHLQVERITDAIDACARGQSSILLVAGEAGVGKTRLVDEARSVAASRGLTVLIGGCLDLGANSIAFAPLREALRGLLSGIAADEVAGILGAAASGLAPLVGDMAPAPESDSLPSLLGSTAQARMFEGWLELFRALARRAPAVLIVEDLHWADPSTLDLLRFLARNQRDTPFLVIATYRSDELHRRHPLLPFLAEMQRSPSISRIDVPRLGRDEVDQLLSGILGEPAAPDDVDQIHTRSDGNPFYVEELAAASRADSAGVALHESLHDVLVGRLDALSDESQLVLKWAAVAGPAASAATLALAMKVEESELDAPLREALEQHFLVPATGGADDRYRFRHMLMQEAMYGELLPGERARFHARLAEVIGGAPGVTERSDLDDRAAELAHHWYLAHDQPRALSWSMRAGAAAERIFAFADAYRQYERVLELWERVPDAEERVGRDRIDVLRAAARCATTWDVARAPGLLEEAIRLAEGHVDDTRLGLIKDEYGAASYNAGDGVTSLAMRLEAVRLVPAEPPSVARATVLASLGQVLMITNLNDEASAACQEAIAVARKVGARQIEAHALDSLGVTTCYLGDLDTALECLREALKIALETNSFDEVARIHSNTMDCLTYSGHFEEAAHAGVEYFAWAEEHGFARTFGLYILGEALLSLYRLGDWAGAAAVLRQAERYRAGGAGEIVTEGRGALLDAGQGHFDVVDRRLRRVEQLAGRVLEAQLIAPQAEAAAERALWLGQPAAALDAVVAALERIPDTTGFATRGGPLYYLGARAAADIASEARAGRDDAIALKMAATAADLATRLRGLRDACVAGLPNFAPQTEAWLAACVAEEKRLSGQSDAELWSAAERMAAAIPMRYQEAYAQWRGAEALLATRQSHQSASELLAKARSTALEIGAAPLMGEIDALARRARLEIAPVVEGDAVAPAAKAGTDYGLTSREIEVVALVAAGLTNRQIAQELFITEGTAGTHVSNVLGKLGVRSRTEAAALAHRLGLAADR